MGRIRVGRPALATVAALAVAVLTVACSSSGSSSSSGPASAPATGSSAATTSIVVGSLPLVDTAGLRVALKEGFFTQAGLNVTVKSVAQSTAAIPDLLHGSIDVIGGGNYVSFSEAQAHGTFPVEVLAPADDCTADTFGVVAMPSSGISKPADLAGKTIAVNLTQNIQTLATSSALTADGVTASSLHYVQVPFPDMVAALKANRVDAVSVVEPFMSAALAARPGPRGPAGGPARAEGPDHHEGIARVRPAAHRGVPAGPQPGHRDASLMPDYPPEGRTGLQRPKR
jgi:NitT/TauT family transport system substrate-binding protein